MGRSHQGPNKGLEKGGPKHGQAFKALKPYSYGVILSGDLRMETKMGYWGRWREQGAVSQDAFVVHDFSSFLCPVFHFSCCF